MKKVPVYQPLRIYTLWSFRAFNNKKIQATRRARESLKKQIEQQVCTASGRSQRPTYSRQKRRDSLSGVHPEKRAVQRGGGGGDAIFLFSSGDFSLHKVSSVVLYQVLFAIATTEKASHSTSKYNLQLCDDWYHL